MAETNSVVRDEAKFPGMIVGSATTGTEGKRGDVGDLWGMLGGGPHESGPGLSFRVKREEKASGRCASKDRGWDPEGEIREGDASELKGEMEQKKENL